MKNYEAEIYMMKAELADKIREDFPVKSRRRAERRKAEAHKNIKKYGTARPTREERYWADRAAEFNHSCRAYNVESRNNKLAGIMDTEKPGEEDRSAEMANKWFDVIIDPVDDDDDDWWDDYEEEEPEEEYGCWLTNGERLAVCNRIAELERENAELRNMIARIAAIINM